MRVLRCNFVLLSILLTTCAQAEDPVILSGDGVTLVIREMQGQGISGDIQINGKTYPFSAKIEEAGDSEIVRGTINAGQGVAFISRQDENSEATLLTIDQKTYRLMPSDQMPAPLKPAPPPPAPQPTPVKPDAPDAGNEKPFNPWGGGDAKPPADDAKPPAAAAPTSQKLRLHKFHDVSMGGVVSHTVLLPEGWVAEGYVEWSTYPTPYPQQKMRIISPMKGRVSYVPLYPMMYTESKPIQGFPQMPAQGTPPPRDIAQWLVWFLTQNNAGISDMRVTEDRRDAAAEAAELQSARAMNTQGSSNTEIHVITLSYTQDHERFREEVMLAYNILPPIDNQNIHSDTWTVSIFYMLAAPDAIFDSHKPELVAVANTLRQTANWFTQVQLTLMELAQLRTEQFAEAIKRRAQMYDSMTKDQEAAFDKRMDDIDHQRNSDNNRIYEKTDYRDTDGSKVKLPSHYHHVWTDGNGNYVMSNNSQQKPGETWTEIESAK